MLCTYMIITENASGSQTFRLRGRPGPDTPPEACLLQLQSFIIDHSLLKGTQVSTDGPKPSETVRIGHLSLLSTFKLVMSENGSNGT